MRVTNKELVFEIYRAMGFALDDRRAMDAAISEVQSEIDSGNPDNNDGRVIFEVRRTGKPPAFFRSDTSDLCGANK